MCDDDNGAPDVKPGMRISVHMDEIDFVPLDQVNEPVAALRKVNYPVRHPFEAIVALDKGHVLELADGGTLSLRRRGPIVAITNRVLGKDRHRPTAWDQTPPTASAVINTVGGRSLTLHLLPIIRNAPLERRAGADASPGSH